jgi:hypothetical protein
VWGAQDDSGSSNDMDRPDRLTRAAVSARSGRGCHLGREHLLERPATALPSRINSSMSASCRSEAFGLDSSWFMPEVDVEDREATPECERKR